MSPKCSLWKRQVALLSRRKSNISGNQSYTRAHFRYYAQVVTPGTYR